MGVAAATMTAFYMTRLLVLTFHGEFRGDHHKWEHAHESPVSMTAVLAVLAVLSVVGGYVGVPADPRWSEPLRKLPRAGRWPPRAAIWRIRRNGC